MIDENLTSIIVSTILQEFPSGQGIYLFGSFQTDQEWKDSDVDLALLLPYSIAKQRPFLYNSTCLSRLERELNKEVDLVNLRTVSTVFQFQVITRGRLIYMGDENAVQEFEMLTLSFYQKLNEERRDILKAFLKTGRAYNV